MENGLERTRAESAEGPMRLVTAADYPLLASWWEGHGWAAVPPRVLPPLGVIWEEQAAGWLYMDNGGTGVAMMEWLVTNPREKPLRVARALMMVVRFLKAEARRMEYPIILTTCRQPALARMLEREGFQISDREMIHLLGVFC